MARPIVFVDLYCGAGGYSTGFVEAMRELGLPFLEVAINHWDKAIETMRVNHPDVIALRMDIAAATPDDIKADVIDLLHASPSCTHHSRAKGGKPRSNQLRSQPNEIWKFVDNKHVRRITIENVPEFIKWGPLTVDGRPDKRREGNCFNAWLQQFTARGYTYEWRILNCADYGDATSRKRFFLQAVKHGCGKIRWPEPTHAENPSPDFFRALKPWRGVRECLDLNDLGRSIFEPGRNLAINTLRRVDIGMRRFNGISFLMDMLGAGGDDDSRVHSLDDPMPTQHAGGNRCAVVRPFIVKMNNNADAEDIDKPLTSVLAGGQHHALCTPFIVRANKGCYAESVDKPLSSEQAHTVHHALCTPFIVNNNMHNVPKSLDKPAPTLTTGNHAMLCQPLIIDHFGDGEAHSVDEPIGAQTTHDRYSLVTPYLITEQANNAPRSIDVPLRAQTTVRKDFLCTPLILGQQGGAQCLPIDEPCPTIATAGAIRLATPIIIDMSRPGGNDSGHIGSADEPIRTITSFDNMQMAIPLVMDKAVGLPRLPDGRYLDIRLRMLKPNELAAAHSFPADYKLAGNRADRIKQIGNSVPVQTAKAIVKAMFESLAA